MIGYWARRAWDGEAEIRDVLVSVGTDGNIARVEVGVGARADAVTLEGVLLPGLVNTHSHAFHRALRGRIRPDGDHHGTPDFWTWREQMYRLAAGLDPDGYRRLATGVFTEMVRTGITAVGEFHYLHHGPQGRRYLDPNEMAHALVDAAGTAGIRLAILDTCYLTADVDGSPATGVQKRFSDGSVEAWIERHRALVDRYRGNARVTVGAAIHSVRALPETAMAAIVSACAGPLHVHVSEQVAENQATIAVHGRTPVRLLADSGVLRPSTTVVHAIHTDAEDHALLRSAGASVCVCPSTESDLGDGFAPTAELAASHVPIALGSDSHAVIDLFSEMRAVEHNDRARLGRREVHDRASLLTMATTGGARALGHASWGLAPGAPADFAVVDDRSIRTAGGMAIDDLALTASAADVTDVVVGGAHVVENGVHRDLPDVAHLLDHTIRELWEELA